MNPITNILIQYDTMILDGALATELEKRDCDLKDPLWSAKILMDNPDLISAVHHDYFAAGADCVITASYQATLAGFMARGLSESEAEELIRQAVLIARRTRDDFWEEKPDHGNRPRPLVAASVGPYGAFLADGSEYRGDYQLSEDELIEFHRRRMQTLIAAGPDLLPVSPKHGHWHVCSPTTPEFTPGSVSLPRTDVIPVTGNASANAQNGWMIMSRLRQSASIAPNPALSLN